MDNYGNVDEFRDSIYSKPNHNSYSSLNSNQQTCHECSKLDLRAKVETNQAYNQYFFIYFVVFYKLWNWIIENFKLTDINKQLKFKAKHMKNMQFCF